jgi:Domain of unknown function (DUF4388)
VTRQLNSFQGPLEKDQLFSLLAYLKSSLSTGRLEVISNLTGEAGYIYLNAGKTVHAECGHLTGKFAMIRLTTMGQGQFDFTVGMTSAQASIVESLENLAMSVAVAVDEGHLTSETNGQTVTGQTAAGEMAAGEMAAGEMANAVEPEIDLDGPLELLTPPANSSVTLEMDMLGLLPLVKPNTTLRGINQMLRWSETRLISVAATLVKNGMLKVGTAPPASVDPAFVQALRQAFTRCVGPAASIVWTNTAKRLGINVETLPESLPESRCIDFLRALAEAISEANAKAKFIEAITVLRKQFNL